MDFDFLPFFSQIYRKKRRNEGEENFSHILALLKSEKNRRKITKKGIFRRIFHKSQAVILHR